MARTASTKYREDAVPEDLPSSCSFGLGTTNVITRNPGARLLIRCLRTPVSVSLATQPRVQFRVSDLVPLMHRPAFHGTTPDLVPLLHASPSARGLG